MADCKGSYERLRRLSCARLTDLTTFRGSDVGARDNGGVTTIFREDCVSSTEPESFGESICSNSAKAVHMTVQYLALALMRSPKEERVRFRRIWHFVKCPC